LKTLKVILFISSLKLMLFSYNAFSQEKIVQSIQSQKEILEQEKIASRSKTMFISGWSLFGIFYLFSLSISIPLATAELITSCPDKPTIDERCSCQNDTVYPSVVLIVPLIGPIYSGIDLFTWAETREAFAIATIFIFDSIIQIIGFSYGVIGLKRYMESKRKIDEIKKKPHSFIKNIFFSGWGPYNGKGLSLILKF